MSAEYRDLIAKLRSKGNEEAAQAYEKLVAKKFKKEQSPEEREQEVREFAQAVNEKIGGSLPDQTLLDNVRIIRDPKTKKIISNGSKSPDGWLDIWQDVNKDNFHLYSSAMNAFKRLDLITVGDLRNALEYETSFEGARNLGNLSIILLREMFTLKDK